jgi:ferredoxin
VADKDHKVPENVPGAWYVDDTCTPCRVCLDVQLAENFLKYNDDETYVYFYRQPDGEEEIQAAGESMAICPQGAIGEDG